MNTFLFNLAVVVAVLISVVVSIGQAAASVNNKRVYLDSKLKDLHGVENTLLGFDESFASEAESRPKISLKELKYKLSALEVNENSNVALLNKLGSGVNAKKREFVDKLEELNFVDANLVPDQQNEVPYSIPLSTPEPTATPVATVPTLAPVAPVSSPTAMPVAPPVAKPIAMPSLLPTATPTTQSPTTSPTMVANTPTPIPTSPTMLPTLSPTFTPGQPTPSPTAGVTFTFSSTQVISGVDASQWDSQYSAVIQQAVAASVGLGVAPSQVTVNSVVAVASSRSLVGGFFSWF